MATVKKYGLTSGMIESNRSENVSGGNSEKSCRSANVLESTQFIE